MSDLRDTADVLSSDLAQAAPGPTVAMPLVPDRTADRVLESIIDGFYALDRDWRFTYLNAQAERLISRRGQEVLGKSIWDEFPEAAGSTVEREYRRAVAEQTPVSFEEFSPPLGIWLEVRAFPSPDGLSVFFRDVTPQAERRQRERFLADLAERARRLTDPDEVIADALRSVGRFLGVSRCIFVDIDIEADTCAAQPDYRADDTVVSMAGTFPISAFGSVVAATYAAGCAVAVDDVRADPEQVPEESVPAYDAVGIRAHIGVPVVHSARLVSCLGAHSSVPRHWKPEEVELLQAVVNQTWLTVEVTRQERARVREAEERREAHERLARTLESIAEAFFTTDREWRYTYINRQVEALWGRTREELLGMTIWESWPEAVGSTFDQQFRRALDEGVAVSFEEFFPPLGAWLEVRAYPSSDGLSVFFQNVNERKRAEVALRESEERYRLLVESTEEGIYGIDLAGCFTFVNRATERMLGFTQAQIIGRSGHALIHHTRPDGAAYPEDECPIYHALRSGETVSVEDDVFWRSNGTAFSVAYSAAPIVEMGKVQGAVVTFSDISERKALEAEQAELAQREHRIAAQLQAALQPPTPASVPGLTLADYYRPAWEDQGVGGDFSDIFSDDKGMTFLVVGDLSGKGLEAASQVAMVRNMLRFSLYNGRSVAGPVGALNRTLADHNLLTGFTTLFVGRYDAGARVLTYVNCGQDAGLILRSVSGRIETLPPTGPVLGAISSAAYTEEAVLLEAGDVLALYTDGLTEAGPSRMALLTGAGVATLLQQQTEIVNPQVIVEHLMAGVDTYAGMGVRDDQCLLVAVVDSPIK